MHDGLYDGRSLRLFNVIDDFNREVLDINNERPNMALGGITPKQKLELAA
jgi:hypothetical protein